MRNVRPIVPDIDRPPVALKSVTFEADSRNLDRRIVLREYSGRELLIVVEARKLRRGEEPEPGAHVIAGVAIDLRVLMDPVDRVTPANPTGRHFPDAVIA